MLSSLKQLLSSLQQLLTRPGPEPPLEVTKLLVHPIKACKGSSVQESRFTIEGLENDRVMVVVDARTHVAITARDYTKMVLIHPEIHYDEGSPYGGWIEVSFPEDSGCDSFRIPLNPTPELLDSWPLVDNVKVWSSINDGYVVQALEGSDATWGTDTPSETISNYLGRSVLLVRKGSRVRAVKPTPTHPTLQAVAAFQDGYPLLLATDASLAELSTNIKMAAEFDATVDKETWKDKEFVIERFRPNIVIGGGGVPWDEERWHELDVGGHTVLAVSICERCPVPHIDPTTGVQDPAVPSNLLNKYRRPESKRPSAPCFGVNACLVGSGVVRVGDKVRVLRRGGRLPIPPNNKGELLRTV